MQNNKQINKKNNKFKNPENSTYIFKLKTPEEIYITANDLTGINIFSEHSRIHIYIRTKNNNNADLCRQCYLTIPHKLPLSRLNEKLASHLKDNTRIITNELIAFMCPYTGFATITFNFYNNLQATITGFPIDINDDCKSFINIYENLQTLESNGTYLSHSSPIIYSSYFIKFKNNTDVHDNTPLQLLHDNIHTFRKLKT